MNTQTIVKEERMSKDEFGRFMAYQKEIVNMLELDFSQEQVCEIILRHRHTWRKAYKMNISAYLVANETRDYERDMAYC